MDGKDIYQAVGNISEQHIADTFAYFRARKRRNMLKIGSIAAVLCLMVTATVLTSVLLSMYKTPAPADPIDPVDPDPVELPGVTSNENGFLIENGELIKYSGEETDVVIPETVTSIADYAFADINGVQSVTLTANVKKVGFEAFSCEKGIRLLLSSDNQYFSDEGDVILSRDGTNLLQYIGTETDSYHIPDGVKQIGAFAFYEAKVDEITFPDGLEYIGKGAFSGCTLREIALPDSVQYIGECAFSECICAVNGSVPDTAEIGTNAFFRVPFYTSLLAGHPCPGEDIQRGTITPSEAIVQSEYLQDINDAVLKYINTGDISIYSDFYFVFQKDHLDDTHNTRFSGSVDKVDITEATLVNKGWGKNIECRANLYITEDQYVSIGLSCTNPYDYTDWKDIKWTIRRAGFYPETYAIQVDDVTLELGRDEDTMNWILEKVGYNGQEYDITMSPATPAPEEWARGCLQQFADGLYLLSWETCDNIYDLKIENRYTAAGWRTTDSRETLTVMDFRSGGLKLTHYFDEIEGYQFNGGYMYKDGLYKLRLSDGHYLSIDWVKYLDGEGGISLHEFDTITIDDVADIDQLQSSDDLNMLCAFIEKDTTALETYSGVSSGTYDLYKTLEFGSYTITQVLSDPDLHYNSLATLTLEVEVLKSDIPEIPVGKHRFTAVRLIDGLFVVDIDRCTRFNANHPDLTELNRFMVALQGQERSLEIPDINQLSKEEMKSYKDAVIISILENRWYHGGYETTVNEVITYAKKLFNLSITKEDIQKVNIPSYFSGVYLYNYFCSYTICEDNQIMLHSTDSMNIEMDILDRTDFGDTITLTVRYYAEGSCTIPAKDVKYTLTKTPDGLAFLSPSELIQDYGRDVWTFWTDRAFEQYQGVFPKG